MTGPALLDQGPLSFVQEEVLSRMLEHPECARRYDLIQIIALDGPLDVRRLERATLAGVVRHPILRTRIRDGSAGPVQCVLKPGPINAILRILNEPAAPNRFAEFLHRAKSDGPEVLAGAQLFRLYLAPSTAGKWLLGVLVHHLVIDSAGYRVFWRDISAAYNGAILPPSPPDYIAHARAERAAFETTSRSALEFWRRMGVPATQRAPLAEGDAATARYSHGLDSAACARLVGAARRYRMTPFLVALAASGQAYARAMGRTNQLLSTDFENREVPTRRDHVAPFINSRACMLHDVDRSLDSLLRPLREMWLDAEAFRDLHAHPLRQRLLWPEPLSVQQDAGDAEVLPDFEGVSAQSVPDPTPEPYWRDALLSWRLEPDRVVLDITFRQDRVSPEIAARLGPCIEQALLRL